MSRCSNGSGTDCLSDFLEDILARFAGPRLLAGLQPVRRSGKRGLLSGVKSNQIKFVTCTEYNKYYSEMLACLIHPPVAYQEAD